MSISIKEFLDNTYHYIMQTLKSDSFTKVSTKNGNVVIMSEEKYNCLIEMMTSKQSDINLKKYLTFQTYNDGK